MHGKKEQSLVQSLPVEDKCRIPEVILTPENLTVWGQWCFPAMWTCVGKAVTPFLSQGSAGIWLASGR
jgi:hypothetical protein